MCDSALPLAFAGLVAVVVVVVNLDGDGDVNMAGQALTPLGRAIARAVAGQRRIDPVHVAVAVKVHESDQDHDYDEDRRHASRPSDLPRRQAK